MVDCPPGACLVSWTQVFEGNGQSVVGDVEGDGDIDIVVSGGTEVVLYLNDGDAMFVETVAPIEDGEISALPRELYASLLIGQSENYCRAWLSGRVKSPPTDHADVFADCAWRSIAEVG